MTVQNSSEKIELNLGEAAVDLVHAILRKQMSCLSSHLHVQKNPATIEKVLRCGANTKETRERKTV